MAVAMAILGVRYTLEQLSEQFISEKGDCINLVVRKPAFLKLIKNSNPVVSCIAIHISKHNKNLHKFDWQCYNCMTEEFLQSKIWWIHQNKIFP